MSRKLKSRIPVVDLFAGAGLFSYAFLSEGFRLSTAVELDPKAAMTYSKNLSHEAKVTDIRDLSPEGEAAVLIAGPPCQGFSTLGKRDMNDPRNQLSLSVLKWVRKLRPRVVVIENVPTFLGSPVWGALAKGLESLGYRVKGDIYNAYDFGIPQIRNRSITFASRGKLPVIIAAPRAGCRTVRQAFKGLPRKPNNKNHHFAPTPSRLALSRMRVIPSGGDKRDVMKRAPKLVPPSWWKVPSEVTDVWGRMEWEAPSNTLRTALLNASKGRYIHPSENRVISLREAARLQSIPEWWTFSGKPYVVARQIGNSVPPRLGRAIAKAVRAVV